MTDIIARALALKAATTSLEQVTNEDYEVATAGETKQFMLKPNLSYNFGEVSKLDLGLEKGNDDCLNKYSFSFSSGSTPTTITLPPEVKWVNNTPITVGSDAYYEVSINNNIASWVSDNGTSSTGSSGGGGIAVETDPTVPAWAKQPNKPTYNYSEILNTPPVERGQIIVDYFENLPLENVGNGLKARVLYNSKPVESWATPTNLYEGKETKLKFKECPSKPSLIPEIIGVQQYDEAKNMHINFFLQTNEMLPNGAIVYALNEEFSDAYIYIWEDLELAGAQLSANNWYHLLVSESDITSTYVNYKDIPFFETLPISIVDDNYDAIDSVYSVLLENDGNNSVESWVTPNSLNYGDELKLRFAEHPVRPAIIPEYSRVMLESHNPQFYATFEMSKDEESFSKGMLSYTDSSLEEEDKSNMYCYIWDDVEVAGIQFTGNNWYYVKMGEEDISATIVNYEDIPFYKKPLTIEDKLMVSPIKEEADAFYSVLLEAVESTSELKYAGDYLFNGMEWEVEDFIGVIKLQQSTTFPVFYDKETTDGFIAEIKKCEKTVNGKRTKILGKPLYVNYYHELVSEEYNNTQIFDNCPAYVSFSYGHIESIDNYEDNIDVSFQVFSDGVASTFFLHLTPRGSTLYKMGENEA